MTMAGDTNVVSWEVDGKRYDVDLNDIDGVEWRDITRAVGMLQLQVLNQALIAKEFDCIGAFIWVWRRRSEPDLTYEDTLRTLSYSSFVQKEDGPTNPPA